MWWRYAAASIRAQLQYPGSVALMSFGQFLATIVDMHNVSVPRQLIKAIEDPSQIPEHVTVQFRHSSPN